MNFKNFKFVKQLKNIAPKFRWIMFGKPKSADYIDNLIPAEKSIEADNLKLEAIVKQSLLKEFGPDIEKSKSYNLLVDAVIHNLKRKQLEAEEGFEEIEF